MKLAINGATTMQNTLEEDIAAAAAAGFAGVELWWDKVKVYLQHKSTSDLQQLLHSNALIPAGLCPFLFSPFRNTDALRDEFIAGLDAAAAIGCDLLVICPDFQPASLTKEEALRRHAILLRQFADLAAVKGIRLAIEPIGGHTLVPGPIEALELIGRAGSPDNVGVLFDTFHNIKSLVEPQRLFAIPLDKLYIVHINDSEDLPLNELTDANRLYPTLGVLPLRETVSVLRQMGYEGFISVEIFRHQYWQRPINDNVRDAYRYLAKVLER